VKGMPEPVQVDATDNMLEKGGAFLFGTETDLQEQEQQATEKAQEAKRIYDNYDQAVQTSSSRMPTFPSPPEMAYEQNAGPRGGGTAVNTSTGVSGSTGMAQPTGGGMAAVNATGGGSHLPATPGSAGAPADTGSSWATPPGTAPGGAAPGAAPGGPGAPGTPGTAPGGPGGGGGLAPGVVAGGPRGGAASPGG